MIAASPIVVDLFAGAGGVSEGAEQALGVPVALAINHDAKALATHKANHPHTEHVREDLFKARPRRPRGKSIDLLWASPDCTHHSRAKGGKPRETGLRLLAWVVVEWARAVLPRMIVLENVAEFRDWGPLDARGKPIKSRKGETFREFVAALQLAGYRVEWQMLCAADFGAPTTRTRLFLVARCDGEPIVWPEPTHGPGRALAWRSAFECIDFSEPMLSVFATPAEALAFGRARLAEEKLTNPRARLGVPQRPLAEATQRRIATGIRRYVLETGSPFIVQTSHTTTDGGKVRPIHEPLSTIVTKAEHCLLVPTLVQTGYGERKAGRHSKSDQRPRVLDIHGPLPTVVAGGQKHGLVAAFLAKHNGSGKDWSKAIGQSLVEPVHTVTGTDTKALVGAFLTKYYGEGIGQDLADPLGTVTTLDRFGLVTLQIDGEPYVISDIGMRMLQPRELARAHAFEDSYILLGSKKDQVRQIGNSVSPLVARAVIAAQFGIDASREAA